MKYTITPTYLFSLYMYIWKKISVRVIVYFTVMFDHPSCFLTFCCSGIPTSGYIFNVFYYLLEVRTRLGVRTCLHYINRARCLWFVWLPWYKVLCSVTVWIKHAQHPPTEEVGPWYALISGQALQTETGQTAICNLDHRRWRRVVLFGRQVQVRLIRSARTASSRIGSWTLV